MTTAEQIEALVVRLDTGWLAIGEAMEKGAVMDKWVTTWTGLLAEYEQLSDELAAMPLEQSTLGGMPREDGE